MKYMGSKNRIAKYILPIILKNKNPWQWYVEPFVGGANMIDKVEGLRIGADINPFNIALFQGLQNGFIPPESVSEEEYKTHQKEKNINPLTAFIGYGCSYGGKWFGGYARGKNSNGVDRNYCAESKRNLLKQKDSIKGIVFKNESYDTLYIPPNSIIYCDPPYANTTGYKGKFNYEAFWDWCRDKKKQGHTIFISEYQVPPDFTCVWQQEIINNLNNKTATEKLFTI